MRLVVDSNVLFSFFWKESVLRRIIFTRGLELYSPEYALEEIKRHKQEIMRKTRLSESEFNEARMDLAIAVHFVALEGYAAELKRAIAVSPDPDDVDFFALALKLGVPLWTNDLALQAQRTIPTYTTQELVRTQEFLENLLGQR